MTQETPRPYLSFEDLPILGDERWARTAISADTRQRLTNYARHALSGQRPPADHGGMTGFLLFQGPPGTGKSTLALGFANEVARSVVRGPVRLITIKPEQLFSELEGKTPKLLAEVFALIKLAGRKQVVIVIVDEIESICFARSQLIGRGDPSDLTRAVNTLLRELDELTRCPSVLVIGTTNFPELIDPAVWDRADLKIRFDLPSAPIRAVILADTIATYRDTGLRLRKTAIEEIAAECPGISGRLLRKSVWMAAVLSGKEYAQLTAQDLATALRVLATDQACNRTQEGEPRGSYQSHANGRVPAGE